jgi:hypothetical protein
VGCGGIATLKFNIDPRKEYVATMSPALYSQGKGLDYPLNKRLGGAQGRPEPCEVLNLLSFLEIIEDSSLIHAVAWPLYRLTTIQSGKYFFTSMPREQTAPG